METFAADTTATMSVAFKRNGQPVIPDAGTVRYRLLDPKGALLTEGSLTPGQTDLSVTVTIPAEFNQISTSFSRRTLIVEGESRGAYLSERVSYRLVPALNHVVTPASVRSYLGANETELPDQDIDVTKAFLDLQIELGSTVLVDALSSGEAAELRANDAILYQCALHLIPSLQLRVAQREQDGLVSFQRNQVRDFEKLRATTEQKLSSALASISTGLEVGYSLLITTNDADPITG